MTGTKAARPTRMANEADCGRRWRRPTTPPRAPIRSPERATHSSAPICGPVAGSESCGVSGASVTSHLLRSRYAEDAGGPDQEEDDQDPEDDHVLVGGRPVADREGLGEPDRDAAQHRAWDAADAADDCGGKGDQADVEPEVGIDVLE